MSCGLKAPVVRVTYDMFLFCASTDLYSAPVMALRGKLWAACRLGDSDLLINSLQTVRPIEEQPKNCKAEAADSEASECTNENSISTVEYLSCLNENVGDNKETLLHVAAQGGHMTIVRYNLLSYHYLKLLLTFSAVLWHLS